MSRRGGGARASMLVGAALLTRGLDTSRVEIELSGLTDGPGAAGHRTQTEHDRDSHELADPAPGLPGAIRGDRPRRT